MNGDIGQTHWLKLDAEPAFDEPWQAQIMAMVDALKRSGTIEPTTWSEAFGDALENARQGALPDTLETYYQIALETLETLLAAGDLVTSEEAQQRKQAWSDAYLTTPHGQPVELKSVQSD